PTVKGDEEELKALEEWMKSYHFEELFDKEKGFTQDILDLVPDEEFLISNNPHVFGKTYKPLVLPDGEKLAKEVRKPGEIQSNAMRMAGVFLKEVFALNKETNN